jgi:hypothetical protein
MTVNTIPEPEWGVSQDTVQDSSAFCLLGPSPFLLTGVLIRLLQYHFSDPNNIDNPVLKDYTWTSNSGCDEITKEIINPVTQEVETVEVPATRIYIGPDYSENPDYANSRPAFFVRRESYQPSSISNRNEKLTGPGACGDPVRGQKMLIQMSGSHSIIAAGETGNEVEQLLEEAYFRMMQYMPVIRDDFKLGGLVVGGAGRVQNGELGGGKKTFYASFAISWTYIYQWTLIRVNPEFRRTLVEYVRQESC